MNDSKLPRSLPGPWLRQCILICIRNDADVDTRKSVFKFTTLSSTNRDCVTACELVTALYQSNKNVWDVCAGTPSLTNSSKTYQQVSDVLKDNVFMNGHFDRPKSLWVVNLSLISTPGSLLKFTWPTWLLGEQKTFRLGAYTLHDLCSNQDWIKTLGTILMKWNYSFDNHIELNEMLLWLTIKTSQKLCLKALCFQW